MSTDTLTPALLAERLGPGNAMLLGVRGHVAGSRYLLDGHVHTVGRHPRADVWLDNLTVAADHAQLRRTRRGWEVVDLGSVGGTWLNGRLVGRARLSAGDELRFGAVVFRVALSTRPASERLPEF